MRDDSNGQQVRRIRLRYPGVCRGCGLDLPRGTWAVHDPASKTVWCESCTPLAQPGEPPVSAQGPDQADTGPTSGAPDVGRAGQAGASARRELERRRTRHRKRVLAAHPRLGKLILAVGSEPQHTRAWETGALGEERLGSRLDAAAGDSTRVLHDRRLPGSRANIDHLVVGPGGVWVIDAKHYRGRPRLEVTGGLFRPRTETLRVGGRDRTRLVDGVLGQAERVRDALSAGPGAGRGLEVMAMLCFVGADWPLIGGSFSTRGVEVCWPKLALKRVTADGPGTVGDIEAVTDYLASSFPPA